MHCGGLDGHRGSTSNVSHRACSIPRLCKPSMHRQVHAAGLYRVTIQEAAKIFP